MLGNKKELEAIQNKLNELDQKIENNRRQNEEVGSANKEFLIQLVEKMNNLQENHSSVVGKFEEEASKSAHLNELFKKRIDALKILENAATKKLLEEVRFEFETQIKVLFRTTKQYNELEDNLKRVANKVDRLMEEIEKFTKISYEIKAADFELTKLAHKISHDDEYKLRLMRENEKMKMLVAKMRSRNR